MREFFGNVACEVVVVAGVAEGVLDVADFGVGAAEEGFDEEGVGGRGDGGGRFGEEAAPVGLGFIASEGGYVGDFSEGAAGVGFDVFL